MVVCPGYLVDSWASEYQNLYPGGKVLTLPQGEFGLANRREFLAKIVTQEWDLIIASHGALKIIENHPASEQRVVEEALAELDTIQRNLDSVDGDAGFELNSWSVKELEKQRMRLQTRLDEL